MKNILLAIALSLPSISMARGHDQGNGGDVYALAFVSLAERVHHYLIGAPQIEVDLKLLRETIETTRVESTNEPLFINGVPKDAVNFPSKKRIIFNRSNWMQADTRSRASLVLHEYLGLLGLETSTYRHTKHFMNDFKDDGTLSGQRMRDTACVLTGQAYAPFTQATTQNDDEYFTIETVQVDGVRFFLKAGHGVARLEAFISNELVSSTFYSYGRSPRQTDKLALEVRAPKGDLVEAQCDFVDRFLP